VVFQRGVTLNLRDFQSERIDIGYPFDHLGPNESFEDAVNWVNTRLQAEIDKVERREAARGNYIQVPRICGDGPEAPAAAPDPPVTAPPFVQSSIPAPVRPKPQN
jgi:hypothetical protein